MFFSNQFINYRDSKLTRILQNALGGNSKTVIVATINPTTIEESHSTLRVSHSRVSCAVSEVSRESSVKLMHSYFVLVVSSNFLCDH